MNLARRWLLPLRRSRWRLAILALAATALATALTLTSAALWPNWHIGLHITIGATLALLLSLPSWRMQTPAAIVLETQRGEEASYGFWVASKADPGPPEPEQVLAPLLNYRRYASLIYLRSAKAQVLIWPDSLEQDTHRQLRVLLGTLRL